MTALGKNDQMKIPSTPFVRAKTKRAENNKGGRRGYCRGYTLVEVIAAILVTAILGVIFVNFMGTAMNKSTGAVDVVQVEAAAEGVLEQIVADYALKMNQNFSTALTLVEQDINHNHLYGTNVSAAYIKFLASGSEDPGFPGTTPSRTLKVTVTAVTGKKGNALTTLLTQSRDANSPAIAF
jgi:prepilin-type N-terminal cleavage/methylation domain-containing protein